MFLNTLDKSPSASRVWPLQPCETRVHFLDQLMFFDGKVTILMRMLIELQRFDRAVLVLSIILPSVTLADLRLI
jgi:hypothetical protein